MSPGCCLSAKEKGSGDAGAHSKPIRDRNLFHLGRDVAERARQLGAEAVHDRDDRNRNAGSDEAILNGRRARLVLGETLNERLHG